MPVFNKIIKYCYFFFLYRLVKAFYFFFFFQAEDGIRDSSVTGVQTCALPISRLGTREWKVLCFLESGDNSITRDSGKPLEKFFECLSAFEIVKESLDGDSRSTEHRGSAKNVGVFDDNSHECIVSRQVEHPSTRGTKTTPLLRQAGLKSAGTRQPKAFFGN